MLSLKIQTQRFCGDGCHALRLGFQTLTASTTLQGLSGALRPRVQRCDGQSAFLPHGGRVELLQLTASRP